MLKINDLLAEVAKENELEAFYLNRPNKLMECCVFSYIRKPSLYTDNTLRAYKYTVLLNIYVRVNEDIEQIRENITNSMVCRSFKELPTVNIQREGEFFNMPMSFEIKLYK